MQGGRLRAARAGDLAWAAMSGPSRGGRVRVRAPKRVSPRAFQKMAAAAVWVLALTIVSGAAVRLTGSGLGCSDWPKCTSTSVVAPLQFHAWVEFGNRLINAAVAVAAIGALAAALWRSPRRKDLTLLAAGLLAGLLAEIVLGGLTVLYKLAPGFVMSHFLLAVVFLGDAAVLHHRARIPDGAAPRRRVAVVGRPQILLARAQLVLVAAVITLGTVVTSTGPHGGDPSARRFGFSLHSVAQLHGTTVELLIVVTLAAMWSLARSSPPRPVLRRAEVLLAALVAQAAVGYAQYFSGDPVGVVAVHVAGATIVVITALRYYFGLFDAQPAAGTGTAGSSPEAAGAVSAPPVSAPPLAASAPGAVPS